MDLQGMTLAVEDLICEAGKPLSCGSRILKGYISPFDATVVARLREAGAVFARCADVAEFGIGRSLASGGLIASGEASAALRCDTGGAVRLSAADCGCVGLKPSYGRVSRHGVVAHASSMDQVGTITRTVEDAAVLLQAIAGHDPLDGTSANIPVPDFLGALSTSSALKGLRIGVPKEYFTDGAHAEVKAAIDGCAKAGAELIEVSLPHTEYAAAVFSVISAAEAATNLARFDGVRYGHRTADHGGSIDDLFSKSRAEGFGDEVKRRIIFGTYVVSKAGYGLFVQAQKVRTLIRKDFEDAFKVCDVMMTPVTSEDHTVPASLAGVCALSVPCGEKAGLQVLGPAFGEELILRAANAYEKEVR